MQKEFSISANKAFLNFTAKYCDTKQQVFASEGFKRFIGTYMNSIKRRNTKEYTFLSENFERYKDEYLVDEVVEFLSLIGSLNQLQVNKLTTKYFNLLKDQDSLLSVIEDIYHYWRRMERYSLIQNQSFKSGHSSLEFINANNKFNDLIINIYREMRYNITLNHEIVYRQLTAGINAGIVIQDVDLYISEEYKAIRRIPFITSVLLQAPFITYPSRNTRSGIFKEVFFNPLKDAKLTESHFYCFPIKVGNLLAYIYFHRDLMSHGISLCNLFEMAKIEECRGKKPDIVYVYGGKNEKVDDNVFYYDKDEDIMVGFVPRSEEIDYFGYIKKMTLTLHNVIMIRRGYLPIHGAMVKVKLNNGRKANICIMGDSGAGKSESLETLRSLSKEYISDMTIIFDDMGSFRMKDGKIMAYGTEIGAFVRLDDLDQGYAFKEMDRSIFMNPDKTNARLVMPVSTYKEITQGYEVDIMLYANNYTKLDENDPSIRIFRKDEIDKAKATFIAGKRFAKGTTSEVGISESFFANPFGPMQKREETEKLIDLYFDKMFQSGVKVGEIYTQLAIKGREKEGPKAAALELFKIISK